MSSLHVLFWEEEWQRIQRTIWHQNIKYGDRQKGSLPNRLDKGMVGPACIARAADVNDVSDRGELWLAEVADNIA